MTSPSPGAGASVTTAARPTVAVGGGAGGIVAVPSASSVLVATGGSGSSLFTTNEQSGPHGPGSVPSTPRTDHVYVAPSVNAAAGTSVLTGPPGRAPTPAARTG